MNTILIWELGNKLIKNEKFLSQIMSEKKQRLKHPYYEFYCIILYIPLPNYCLSSNTYSILSIYIY